MINKKLRSGLFKAFCAVLLVTVSISIGSAGQYIPEDNNRIKYNFNINWKYYQGDVTGAEEPSYDDTSWETVHLPHLFEHISYHFSSIYRGIGWYRKHFLVEASHSGRKVYVEFEGAMTTSEVWVNNNYIGIHYVLILGILIYSVNLLSLFLFI